ncbi:hypothetical protein R3X26_05315 [Vibrio sp. TH_r3]|uniref:hypothetical protein n=1 Tax=Vibrio sp. TH_r3 TaxID=3082084 RepID=UPI002953BBE7|nr:hypothetical protein [Vibrio sp. TH_r3]MDV7103827.1 hypothetical protein [Vibrio sp. TH_r3]
MLARVWPLIVRSLIVITVVLLNGCYSPSKVGGTCHYVQLADIAKLTDIQQSTALLVSESEQYQVELALFTSPPVLDANYRITLNKITQGTCTPILIETVEPIANIDSHRSKD